MGGVPGSAEDAEDVQGVEDAEEMQGMGTGRVAGFAREAAGSLAMVAAFVAGGLGWAVLQGAAYPGNAMADAREPGPATPARVWLVDGFNLLHAAVLSAPEREEAAEWWREAGRERVLALAAGLAEPGAEVWVVFDGVDDAPAAAARDDARTGGVRPVFAPSADEWLVRRVKATPRGTPVAVVTADRKVADRARHHGAEIVSPRAFAERCGGGPGSTRASGGG